MLDSIFCVKNANFCTDAVNKLFPFSENNK